MIRPTRDIIVIGGSAGGLDAAMAILAALPAGFPAAVFIALHRGDDRVDPHGLTRVLRRGCMLPIESARDEQPVEPGYVYVATGNQHLLLENGILRVQESPREHWFRPSIDVLFKSAALTYGRRVIGVLLSGFDSRDGAAGLWQIRHRGGVTIVQHPDDAEFPGMPLATLADVAVDHVLPLRRIVPQLLDLVVAHADAPAPPRILIVEDESVVATNLQQSLAEMGYDVVDQVASGEAAIEVAQRERPDLILMDIRLAGALTGVEAARRIWQTLQIPVVYLTAHADHATLKSVLTTEVYGYVVKPFETPAVRAAVELALARREKELR